MKGFDKELEAFSDTLSEYPVSFPPSYPFEENTSNSTTYMQTRCPAWCDRVVFSKNVKKLVNETKPIDYGLMGINACMGDHKVRERISMTNPVTFKIGENCKNMKACIWQNNLTIFSFEIN